MTDRLWDRTDEWGTYARCAGDPDFIIEPTKLGPERTAAVQKTCAGCAVRPECIEVSIAPVVAPFSLKVGGGSNPVMYPSSSTWVAGEWLPGNDTAESRRNLQKVKDELRASLPYEYATRSPGLI